MRDWSDRTEGAALCWATWQKWLYTCLLLLGAVVALLFPSTLMVGMVLLLFYGSIICVRVGAVIAGLLRRNTVSPSGAELQILSDDMLPVYTILLPVYREADMISPLIESLGGLDYPCDKLDVKLLLESDDTETLAATKALDLPEWVEVVTVLEGGPKTKPRACNVGLQRARGEYLVIYDAEDRPEPDQLKKAVAAFLALPSDVACLQAKLNYYNSRENLLSRWSALEYTAWFDLYLPGLHAVRAPIPLGGTSNHFKTAVLHELSGWDPYNVTEDCDLGIRLELAGHETRVLDSTTWEEAVSRWAPWLRQRSRWMKGYWQTHLCHTRHPIRDISSVGLWKWTMMLAVVGGQVLSMLVNPICWVIMSVWLVFRWDLFDPYRPATVALLVGAVAFGLFNILFVVIHLLGAIRRGRGDLLLSGLLLPFYWVMVSVGAWRGFVQFFFRPFMWEKTPHGLVGAAAAEAGKHDMSKGARSHAMARIDKKGPWTAAVIAGLCGCILFVAFATPRWFNITERIRQAALQGSSVRLDGSFVGDERDLDVSWFGKEEVLLEVELSRSTQVEEGVEEKYWALVYLKVWDGEWFEHVVTDVSCSEDSMLKMSVSLVDGWRSDGDELPWGPWCLRRVREVGVRAFGSVDGVTAAKLVGVSARGQAEVRPLKAVVHRAPAMVARYDIFQADFELGRYYENPFDPRQVDVWGVFVDEGGASARVPAFYTRDFRRALVDGQEQLTPVGKPYWAVRFAPNRVGDYRWHLEGSDHSGEKVRTDELRFRVSDSEKRGYVRVDKDSRYFSYDNGEFFYPVAINIRSPNDERVAHIPRMAVADPRPGTYVMDGYLDRMRDAGMNMGRMWLMPSWCGLAWRDDCPGYHGMEFYNLQNAWRVDHLLNGAAARGLLLELALSQHGQYTEAYDREWEQNPMNSRNGGFLNNPRQTMVNDEARRIFRNTFRYAAARYGASPSLFGWVIMIEANIVNPDSRILAKWHGEMGRELKATDVGRHLVSAEFTNDGGTPSVWQRPEIDYVQAAAYNWGKGLASTFWLCLRKLNRYDKPVLLEEYVGHPMGGGLHWLGHEIHDGPWLGWVLPVSGTPMPWWWNVVFDYGLDRHHKRFSEFIAGEDLRETDWQYSFRMLGGDSSLFVRGRTAGKRGYFWIYGPSSEFVYSQNGPMRTWMPEWRYRKIAGRFEPLAVKPGRLFGPVRGGWVDLSMLGLEDGEYEAEVWDTWSEQEPWRGKVVVSDGEGELMLPELVRDVAVKLRKVGG